MPVARKQSGMYIGWKTIRYRSVVLSIVLVILSAYCILYFVFPTSAPVRYISDLTDRLIAKLDPSTRGKSAGPGIQQAHFTAIDGLVKVKKGNSNVWISATYDLPLERGDVVQTGSEGIAKLVFVDGTNYTVKQDSLIVIEEYSANADQQTNVQVQVTSGNVDLATATFTEGSRSAVIVAGARAALAPESAAAVHNDPRRDEHNILVKKGSGTVERNGQTVPLRSYEMVSFKTDSPQLTKSRELPAPTLITPANLAPVFSAGGPVMFEWTPITGSHGYHVRISTNPYFSSPVFDRTVAGSSVQLPGLKDGHYYWTVSTIDINGKRSVDSEHNQFSVLAKKPEQTAVELDLMPFTQHGRLVEVRGKTEATARVIINGQEVPLVKGDGSFSYLMPPLAPGPHVISITAQNSRGASRTEQRTVTVE